MTREEIIRNKANLRSANLRSANLRSANLSSAKGVFCISAEWNFVFWKGGLLAGCKSGSLEWWIKEYKKMENEKGYNFFLEVVLPVIKTRIKKGF